MLSVDTQGFYIRDRYKWQANRHFYKGDNVVFPVFGPMHQYPSGNGSTLKGKNLLPEGANSFHLE